MLTLTIPASISVLSIVIPALIMTASQVLPPAISRACYGWKSSEGSIFTHDKNFGHTGIQPKIDSNTQKVDTNRKIAWLTANGKPEGWKMFKK